MLQTIRDKITGWIAWFFIAVIAVVFIFWGVDFGTGSASYAAKVDGERISAQEVRRAWQQQQSRLQQMLRSELPDEMVKSQQAAILDQFVRQSLLEQRAHEFGYRISDELLVQRIREVPEFQVDGKFSKDRYNAVLRANGLTEPQFENDLRSETLIRQLQAGIIDSAFVTTQELERRFALEHQQREIDYALIATNSFMGGVSITDEQVQKWYEEHRSEYLLPEKVDLQYAELTRDRAEAAVEVSEQALREYYEQVKEKYESPERRKARHILITTGDGLDDAAAEKKAAELAAKVQGGADFAQLAKENSKDPGSAAQGGDLGWAQRGMFVGPFEEALFSMNVGEVRGPVKTQFGYHVLKLEEIEPRSIRSFEDARAELEGDYRAERSQALFYEQTEKLGDLAFESLTELESVATALDLQLKTVADFTREGGGELGNNPEIIEAAFSPDVLEGGQNSPLIAVGEDRAIVLRVTKHTPAEPRPLAEVRTQIESQIRTQAAREAAERKGEDIIARLQKGEAWQDVVGAAELAPVGKRFVTRQDTVAPPAVVQAAFDVASANLSETSPHFAGVTTADGNYAVLQVTQVRDGDPSGETETAKMSRRRAVERQFGNEEFAAYVQEAERNADIVKNQRVFE
jgi:peptidyl-prolyl cis-trans isomerase D